MTTAPIYSVTGRVWDAATRQHSKLTTIDFERKIDATSFMNINREWIAGMVLDMNADARALEAGEVTSDIAAAKLGELELEIEGTDMIVEIGDVVVAWDDGIEYSLDQDLVTRGHVIAEMVRLGIAGLRPSRYQSLSRCEPLLDRG